MEAIISANDVYATVCAGGISRKGGITSGADFYFVFSLGGDQFVPSQCVPLRSR
jgi:hypothetical protein